ncbi:choice-of-anchor D domain-containing protein [Hanstruepera ponticola]|uniref:choice-of-anchor D domain-containing protein n=1 Tax=Hanstruepera ponticola TaxID=2042995 RepID=UPI000CF1477D|nr:choice-of-anchor D domain-containing protein [Hanstruepera ponticola]
MNNKTTLILLSFFFCAFSFAQGTLEVSGSGNTISNPDTTPTLVDGTDFGDVGISTASVNTFTLDNTANGGSPANRLNNITVGISGSSDFALSATNLGNLKGNDTPIDLDVTFTPSSTGSKTATITITFTNGTNSPYTFDIQGNGIISPADINILGNGNNISDGSTTTSANNHTDFSIVNNGSSLVRVFTIENTGGSDLTNISNVSLTNNTEFQVSLQPAVSTLSAGNSTTFEITFSPTSTGNYSDTVTITSDDTDESPYTFSISGEGVIPALVNEDSIWKYYDLQNEPANDGEGDSWIESDYNDGSWNSGNAELGYGDGDEATVINNATEVAYFRQTINIPDASLYNDLVMEAIRDDGMIVYINGTEVWRDNMDPGAVNYNTFANSVVGGGAETTWISKTIASNLVNGNNVIAVEIHQENAGSSDISFNFRMQGYEAVPAVVERGPYLQKATPSSIIIKWRTNTSAESIVNYGTSLGSLTSNITDNNLKIDHEVELTGLNPNTKYYFNIANDEGVYLTEDVQMYAKTAPNVGTDQFVRAWILGDAGTANQDQRDVRDQYYSYVQNASVNPDLTDMMLFLGDNAYNSGTDTEYQAAFFDIYGDMLKKSTSWSTLGNHDGYSANSSSQSGPYYDIFSFPTAAESGGLASGTEAYYSFDYANIHFIVLESYTLSNDAAQMAWCTNDIQNTTQDWIVAIFHHPAYTKGSHNSDTESQLINMRNNFLPILEANGVDLVLSGHSHSYERSYFLNGHYGTSGTFNSGTMTVGANGGLSGKADTGDGAYSKTNADTEGAVYITTGSAGKISGGNLNHNAMYASLNQLGSCVLELENSGGVDQNLTVKFITNTGSVTDYFTINKNGFTLSTETNALEDNTIKVFPVPANDLLNIKTGLNETFKSIKFYNTIGEVVKISDKSVINVSNMSTGMYLIEIKTDNKSYFKSIIIE